MPITPAYRKLLASTTWDETPFPEEVALQGLPLPASIFIQHGAEGTVGDWLRGIRANAQLRLSARVPDDVTAVALYEDPESREVLPAMLVEPPQLIVNGHGLLAYTSACAPDVAGFMMASWMCAWMPVDDVRAMLAEMTVAKEHVEPDAPFTTH